MLSRRKLLLDLGCYAGYQGISCVTSSTAFAALQEAAKTKFLSLHEVDSKTSWVSDELVRQRADKLDPEQVAFIFVQGERMGCSSDLLGINLAEPVLTHLIIDQLKKASYAAIYPGTPGNLASCRIQFYAPFIDKKSKLLAGFSFSPVFRFSSFGPDFLPALLAIRDSNLRKIRSESAKIDLRNIRKMLVGFYLQTELTTEKERQYVLHLLKTANHDLYSCSNVRGVPFEVEIQEKNGKQHLFHLVLDRDAFVSNNKTNSDRTLFWKTVIDLTQLT